MQKQIILVVGLSLSLFMGCNDADGEQTACAEFCDSLITACGGSATLAEECIQCLDDINVPEPACTDGLAESPTTDAECIDVLDGVIMQGDGWTVAAPMSCLQLFME